MSNPTPSSPADTCDIAIIGGGMVGASLATMLASACPAWQITLIEAQPVHLQPVSAPSFDARSTALAEGSAQVFRALGLWTALAAEASPITEVQVSDSGHLGGSRIRASDHNLPAVGYVVENARLGQALYGKLSQQPQVKLLAPVRVTRATPLKGGYRLHLDGGASTEVRCRLLVVADGGDSALRRSLGIHTRINHYGQTALIANVAFSKSHQGVAYERFTPAGPLALLPLDGLAGRRAALIWTHPNTDNTDWAALPDAPFLSSLQQAFGWRLGRFEHVGQRFSYPLALMQAEEQVRSSLALMGNAAHFLHPVAGQGFNLALRDCAVLVETLAEAEHAGAALGTLAVLQRYLERQLPDQVLTTQFSDRLVRLFSTANLAATSVRHLGLLGLELMPVVKQAFATQAMGRGNRRIGWPGLSGESA